jgi:hypothetical protein
VENGEGSITLLPTDAHGTFTEPFSVGHDLGHVCAPADGDCGGCGAGNHCEIGRCVVDTPEACEDACAAGSVCRHLVYRGLSIADFNGDGALDFLAHSWPARVDGTHDLWIFTAGTKQGLMEQSLIGTTPEVMAGVVADLDGDGQFDLGSWRWRRGPDGTGNLSDLWFDTYLHGPQLVGAPCALGAAGDGCAFSATPRSADARSVTAGQWTYQTAREAQDLSGDGIRDLILGVVPSGGIFDATIYMLAGNGDGSFLGPAQKRVHGGSRGAPTSIVFADFDNDLRGDVAMGLDDDGDAGAMWLYRGQESGGLAAEPTKVFDLNPGCNSGCGDNEGVADSARAFDIDSDGNADIIVGYRQCAVGSPNCDIFSAPPRSRLVFARGHGDGSFDEPAEIVAYPESMEATRFQVPQRLCVPHRFGQ